MNAISDAIYKYLTPDKYQVDEGAGDYDGILVRSAKCYCDEFPKPCWR